MECKSFLGRAIKFWFKIGSLSTKILYNNYYVLGASYATFLKDTAFHMISRDRNGPPSDRSRIFSKFYFQLCQWLTVYVHTMCTLCFIATHTRLVRKIVKENRLIQKINTHLKITIKLCFNYCLDIYNNYLFLESVPADPRN